jgi:phytoene dehydrogenase-like protein
MSPQPVVVVGAGHNGLVCAVKLAAAGLSVIVLEQAEHPGGAVSSHTRTLPGFVHDTCAGFFPLTLASPAFDELGIREQVAWVNPDVAMAHPFCDGSAIVLHRSLEATVESLEQASAGAGFGWRQRVAPLLVQRERVLRAALTDSFPPVRDGLALAAALRRDGIELARLMLASSASASSPESESIDRRRRSGVVEEVLRRDPPPRYRIRWDDGHRASTCPQPAPSGPNNAPSTNGRRLPSSASPARSMIVVVSLATTRGAWPSCRAGCSRA